MLRQHIFTLLISSLLITSALAQTQNQPIKIAFIGDTGAGDGFQAVLNLIKQEAVDLTVVTGDTSYDAKLDAQWDHMVRSTLPNDAALIAAGNHDYDDSDIDTVLNLGQQRLRQQQNVRCLGDYGENMTCTIHNVHLVFSSIGTKGFDFLQNRQLKENLSKAPNDHWRICVWHKNQRAMQVGSKRNEVGWEAYEACREHGAFIATGHEHSYSRTHLLSDMSEQTIADSSDHFHLTEGTSFTFVSGLGGREVRDQDRGGNWWASIYTQDQDAQYGALFAVFHPDHAEFYFKNIKGEIIDQFTAEKGYWP